MGEVRGRRDLRIIVDEFHSSDDGHGGYNSFILQLSKNLLVLL